MFKTYSSYSSARAAIRKAGLSQMVVRYDHITDHRIPHFLPVVLCDLVEDTHEVERRGFKAQIKRETFCEGATIKMKPGVTGYESGMAVIRAMLDDIEGGVMLDRPLGGCRYWNVEDLILIAPEKEDA